MLVLPLLAVLSARYVTVSADLDDTGPLTEVYAVEKQTAYLPCDVTPPVANDELRLVLWYYGTEGTPMYTYDVRDRLPGAGSHWSAEHVDRARVKFAADRQPPALRIRQTHRADGRLYRCRVDFLHSPTRNSRVLLTVITPPANPVIQNSNGRVLHDVTWRRYREGETVRLTCTVTGGHPAPNVTWWRDSELLDSVTGHVTSPGGAVRSHVTVGPLSRDHLGQRYTCSASNHVSAPPRTASVSVDMLLAPLSVRLLGANSPLSAGVTYQLTCQSAGSRPSAVISWWRGDRQLTAVDQTHSDDGNVTTSRLRFTPAPEDDGRLIRCRVQNPLLSAAVEDVWQLSIRFAPEVSVRRLSSDLDSSVLGDSQEDLREGQNVLHEGQDALREGQDARLQCRVRAAPPPLRITWERNGMPLVSDRLAGVVITNDTLLLHQVTREAAGQYTCSAANSEGSGTSAPLRLTVRYAPRCADDQELRYGASRGEPVYVSCRVDADPPPRRFFWAFNASGVLIDVPESHTESTGETSLCRYTPRRDTDFGALLCWAENDAGEQRQPCVFHVVRIERPGSLFSCTITNVTTDSLMVRCEPGTDGGARQTFVMELTDAHSGRVVTNVTADVPRFAAPGLLPGRQYLISVYARNSRGRGERYHAAAVTAADPAQRASAAEREDAAEPAADGAVLTPLLGALVGASGALMLMLIVVLIGVRLRARRRRQLQRRHDRSPGPLTAADTNNLTLLSAKRKTNTDIIQMEFSDADEKLPMIERHSAVSGRPTPLGRSDAAAEGHPSPQPPRPPSWVLQTTCNIGAAAASSSAATSAAAATSPATAATDRATVLEASASAEVETAATTATPTVAAAEATGTTGGASSRQETPLRRPTTLPHQSRSCKHRHHHWSPEDRQDQDQPSGQITDQVTDQLTDQQSDRRTVQRPEPSANRSTDRQTCHHSVDHTPAAGQIDQREVRTPTARHMEDRVDGMRDEWTDGRTDRRTTSARDPPGGHGGGRTGGRADRPSSRYGQEQPCLAEDHSVLTERPRLESAV